jgi:hypothetical protein
VAHGAAPDLRASLKSRMTCCRRSSTVAQSACARRPECPRVLGAAGTGRARPALRTVGAFASELTSAYPAIYTLPTASNSAGASSHWRRLTPGPHAECDVYSRVSEHTHRRDHYEWRAVAGGVARHNVLRVRGRRRRAHRRAQADLKGAAEAGQSRSLARRRWLARANHEEAVRRPCECSGARRQARALSRFQSPSLDVAPPCGSETARAVCDGTA